VADVTKSYNIDRNSDTWRSIRAYIDDRIELRRTNLETPGVDPVDTECQRGAIEELKELRALGEPRVVEDVDEAQDAMASALGGSY